MRRRALPTTFWFGSGLAHTAKSPNSTISIQRLSKTTLEHGRKTSPRRWRGDVGSSAGTREVRMSDFLVLSQVGKSFGSTPAVRNLSFQISRGECLVFLGPSGCGKTTTLNMIAGF